MTHFCGYFINNLKRFFTLNTVDFSNRNRKCAFTLAEVLITLGIIGVVAAITTPTLINSYRNKTLEAQFKKQYSLIQQALLNMQEQEGAIPNYQNFPGHKFVKTFQNYYSILADCKNSNCEAMDMEAAGGEYGNLTSKVYRTYNNAVYAGNGLFDDGQFMISDGSFLLFNTSTVTSRIIITVDTNGYHAAPNRWGLDLFTFQIEESSGKLLPMGTDGTYFIGNFCSVNSSNKMNGLTCAYRALTENNYFKNLPR